MGFHVDLSIPNIGMTPDMLETATKLCKLSLIHPDGISQTPWPDLSDEQLRSLADRFCGIRDQEELHTQLLQMLAMIRQQSSDSRAVAIWARQANSYIGQLPRIVQEYTNQLAEQVVAQSRPDLQNPN